MSAAVKHSKVKGNPWTKLHELVSARGPRAPTAGTQHIFISFNWELTSRGVSRDPRSALKTLIHRVKETPPSVMYDAVEKGVPTLMVQLIANAFRDSRESVMDLIGVSETTFRRKEEAKEPLPEIAGHRVMAFLRIVAKLQRLLEESGDPEEVASFDLEGWVRDWIREPLPELGNKSPAEMLRNPEGQRAVEELLERMRGGLPA